MAQASRDPVRSRAAMAGLLAALCLPPFLQEASAEPAGEWKAIETEAVALRERVARHPKEEKTRQRLAELAVRAARGAERALSRGDEALFRAYRELVERRLHDTRWRMGRMSEQGSGAAAFALGVLSLHGILEPRSVEQACRRFSLALEHGFSGAKFRHSQCLEEREPERAAALLREAADAGHVAAIERVGRACLEATPPDAACARARLERAAKEGRASATALLGWMHAEGIGTPPDLHRAAALYREAGEGGEPSALNNLGELLENGRGVERDERAAFERYRKAAEAGFAPAQFNLGRLYAAGKGVARNEAEARRWLGEARKGGIEPAARILEWLDGQAGR